MALQSSNVLLPGDAYKLIRDATQSWKAVAQNALASMQTGSVNTDFIFKMLDQLNQVISSLAVWKVVSGLDTYAAGQGYSGTLSTDCTTTSNAAQTCINWTVTNFPADAQGFLEGYTLNTDGTRTPRSFTSTNTAGLQTNLQSFIATIT